ncbi:MAG: hypothetical protein IKW28_01060 [Lachnospiraceae bacterium]|nr:hypothetical protein [Lachnospiraceae bacterium]
MISAIWIIAQFPDSILFPWMPPKYYTFRTASHQTPLPYSTDSATIIYETACKLFQQLRDETPARLLVRRTSKLSQAVPLNK